MNMQNNIEQKEWLTLFEISQALSSTFVLDELLELILQSVRKVIKASFGMENKKDIVKDIKIEGGIAGKVVELKKPFLLKGDIKENPQLKGMVSRNEVKSAISVPLIAKGDVVGVFNLSRLTIEENFTDRELNLVTIFAGPVAIAIYNAQLYNRIKNLALHAESERDKLKAILENISNGIIIINKNGIIPLLNPTAVKILRIDSSPISILNI